MKRIGLFAACSLLTSSLFAAIVGPYIGVGGGYGNLRTPNGGVFSEPGALIDNSRQTGGPTGRVFGGYNLYRYLGMEVGWTYYPRSVYKSSDIYGNNSQIQYNSKVVDGEFKLYFPFGYSGANVYAMLGAAYVNWYYTYNDGGIGFVSNFFPPPPGTTHIYKTRPLYGIGASYDFPCHFSMDVQFMQIQRLNTFYKNSNAIPFINLATIDFIYRPMM